MIDNNTYYYSDIIIINYEQSTILSIDRLGGTGG